MISYTTDRYIIQGVIHNSQNWSLKKKHFADMKKLIAVRLNARSCMKNRDKIATKSAPAIAHTSSGLFIRVCLFAQSIKSQSLVIRKRGAKMFHSSRDLYARKTH